MITYNNCRMDHARALKDMGEMLELVKAKGVLTAAEFVYMLGIKPSRVDMYVTYLCGLQYLAVAEKARAVANNPKRASYRLGPLANEPLPVGSEGGSAAVPHQKTIAPNDWPRGQEHVRRTGLLAYLYPMAQG